MKILLALDGSEHSEGIVREVVRRHFPPGSEVRVISVVERLYFPGAGSSDGVDIVGRYDEIEKSARDAARATVEKAAAKLRASRESGKFTITTEVLSGSPKSVILEDAEAFGADLIVVGSHGRGMLERFLLGSVSQAVALHAKCSVEIVRTPNAQTSDGK